MTFIHFVIFTIFLFGAGTLCFLTILILEQGKRLHEKHFRFLCATGVPAFALIVLIAYNLTPAPGVELTVILVTICALLCFFILTSRWLEDKLRLGPRDIAQGILWGQFVFPVVLLGIPEVILIAERWFG